MATNERLMRWEEWKKVKLQSKTKRNGNEDKSFLGGRPDSAERLRHMHTHSTILVRAVVDIIHSEAPDPKPGPQNQIWTPEPPQNRSLSSQRQMNTSPAGRSGIINTFRVYFVKWSELKEDLDEHPHDLQCVCVMKSVLENKHTLKT